MEQRKHIPSLQATAGKAQPTGSSLLQRNLSNKDFGPVFAQSVLAGRGQGIGFPAGALITTTINSGETVRVALQAAAPTAQIKGLQVMPQPLLAGINHGMMIHEFLHRVLPET